MHPRALRPEVGRTIKLAPMSMPVSTILGRTIGWLSPVIAGVLLTTAPDLAAQPIDEPAARPLTGVLRRIKDTGVVHLGYRQSAVPFSFASQSGRPLGYSIDLCHAIVEDIASAIGGDALRLEYRLVTPTNRIDQVVEGKIDLECGTTTSTTERRQRVAFSPLIFIAGTRLLVKRGAPIHSLRDLNGRTVIVVRGTTNEAAMKGLAADRARNIHLLVADDYPAALAKLKAGDGSALAADDVLMVGLLAAQRLGKEYAIVGELLSYEPYGIMFAKDDAPLAEAVKSTFIRLATSREIRSIYNQWFMRPLPSGVRLGLPFSGHLERSFEILGLPPE